MTNILMLDIVEVGQVTCDSHQVLVNWETTVYLSCEWVERVDEGWRGKCEACPETADGLY